MPHEILFLKNAGDITYNERSLVKTMHPPLSPHSKVTPTFSLMLIAMIAHGAFLATTHAATYLSESFTGATAPGWVFAAGQGDNPILTASDGIDTPGNGWLRLNTDTLNQATFSYHENAIPTHSGLIITFDFVIWTTASTNSTGDGFALTLFQPTANPAPGAYGGSLGYAQRTDIEGDIEGMTVGVLGVGFDVFGNFSRASEGRVGGPGQRKHSIAVRGPMGATRNEGYAYIGGTESLDPFSTSGATTTRASATTYTARVTISPSAAIQVDWRPENGEWETLFDCDCPAGTLPEELMIGFTAGTGFARSTHEIRNLSVTAIPEPGPPAFVLLFVGALVVGHRRRQAISSGKQLLSS